MARMQLPEAFKEFLAFLNKYRVKYLVVGGWAVGVHAAPRFTANIDIWIAIDDKNLSALLKALIDFGAPHMDVRGFKEPKNVYKMGRPPLKIEVINSIDGREFNDCWPSRKKVRVDNLSINFISRKDLIINKKESGRPKDLADLDSLKDY